MRTIEEFMRSSKIELKEGKNVKLLGEGSIGIVYRYNFCYNFEK